MTRIAVLYPDIAPPGCDWPVDVRFSLIDAPDGEVWRTAQKLVGGYIEILALESINPAPGEGDYSQDWHLSAYVNEEGILRGFPASCRVVTQPIPDLVAQTGPVVLFGPVVFVSEMVDRNGDSHYRDLSDADYQAIQRMIQLAITVPSLAVTP